MDSCSRYERKNHGAVYVVSVRGGGVLRGNLRIRDRAGVHIATDGSHADSGRWARRRDRIATPRPWSEVWRKARVRGLIRFERQRDCIRVVTAICLPTAREPGRASAWMVMRAFHLAKEVTSHRVGSRFSIARHRQAAPVVGGSIRAKHRPRRTACQQGLDSGRVAS